MRELPVVVRDQGQVGRRVLRPASSRLPRARRPPFPRGRQMNSASVPGEIGTALATRLANLRLGTTPPGAASGRIGLALVAIGLVAVFSVLNASFFSVGNFIPIGVNSTSSLIAVLGTSALLIA